MDQIDSQTSNRVNLLNAHNTYGSNETTGMNDTTEQRIADISQAPQGMPIAPMPDLDSYGPNTYQYVDHEARQSFKAATGQRGNFQNNNGQYQIEEDKQQLVQKVVPNTDHVDKNGLDNHMQNQIDDKVRFEISCVGKSTQLLYHQLKTGYVFKACYFSPTDGERGGDINMEKVIIDATGTEYASADQDGGQIIQFKYTGKKDAGKCCLCCDIKPSKYQGDAVIEQKPTQETLDTVEYEYWQKQGIGNIFKNKPKFAPPDYKDPNIDLDEVFRILDDQHKNMPDTSGQSLILFLGNTGSGKSTSINYICGQKMVQVKSGKQDGIEVEGDEPLMKIGHTKKSETAIPKTVQDPQNPNITYCDLPGFKDNRGGNYELSISLLSTAVIKNSREIAVMLLFQFSDLVSNRGLSLRELLKQLQAFLTNYKDKKESIMFLVTKIPKQPLEEHVEYKLRKGKKDEELNEPIDWESDKVKKMVKKAIKEDKNFAEQQQYLGYSGKQKRVLDELEELHETIDDIFDVESKELIQFMWLCKDRFYVVDPLDDGFSKDKIRQTIIETKYIGNPGRNINHVIDERTAANVRNLMTKIISSYIEGGKSDLADIARDLEARSGKLLSQFLLDFEHEQFGNIREKIYTKSLLNEFESIFSSFKTTCYDSRVPGPEFIEQLENLRLYNNKQATIYTAKMIGALFDHKQNIENDVASHSTKLDEINMNYLPFLENLKYSRYTELNNNLMTADQKLIQILEQKRDKYKRLTTSASLYSFRKELAGVSNDVCDKIGGWPLLAQIDKEIYTKILHASYSEGILCKGEQTVTGPQWYLDPKYVIEDHRWKIGVCTGKLCKNSKCQENRDFRDSHTLEKSICRGEKCYHCHREFNGYRIDHDWFSKCTGRKCNVCLFQTIDFRPEHQKRQGRCCGEICDPCGKTWDFHDRHDWKQSECRGEKCRNCGDRSSGYIEHHQKQKGHCHGEKCFNCNQEWRNYHNNHHWERGKCTGSKCRNCNQMQGTYRNICWFGFGEDRCYNCNKRKPY